MHYNSCIICGRAIRAMRDSKSCTSCKKHIHSACDPTPGSSDNLFTCSLCREKSMVDGDADDAVMPCVATERVQRQRTSLYLSGVDEEADEDDEDEIEYGTAEPPSSSGTSIRRHATRNSHRISPLPSKLTETAVRVGEVFACSSAGSRGDSHNLSPAGELISSSGALLDDDPFLGSSPIQVRIHSGSAEFFSNSSQRSGSVDDNSSLHDNSSPTTSAIGHNHMSEEPMSDSDEYKPISRGGRNVKKKPVASTSRQSTSMRTRSGGKPPATSYARIGYIEEPTSGAGVEPASGERSRRTRMVKGKGGGSGGGRGRRGGGRGTKYANFLFPASGRRETDGDDASVASGSALCKTEGGSATSKKTGGYAAVVAAAPSTAADNDYVRTAVVTNAADNFMCQAAACALCGSVGREAEGTMIACASCAQTFHTYCVGVHAKLNSAVLKRGWRCLDCTVCEGCGSGKDESNLLLCEECDVSFHTYCLDPPLDNIPAGPWRCKWCAMCCRCNKRVQSSMDLQRFEGLCEVCYSMRKCLRCTRLYEAGELLIKCQRCIRWFHARCEHILTEEQAENAAENAFRCSFCRPQSSASYNDVINTSVIVDNVMIDKASADYIQNVRRPCSVLNGGGPSIHETMASVIRNSSCDLDDFDADDAIDAMGYTTGTVYSGRGRGGCGRGGGPGRRPPKIGVGGFNVKTPRHRLAMLADEQAAAQQQQQSDATCGDEDTKAGKIRRTRKSRKPQLESAYPPEIQHEFFGFGAVDSRTLADVMVDEPVLGEFKKPLIDVAALTRTGAELSEQSAELLRNEQEQDMLGDIFTGVGDLPLDLDFDDIMNGAADDDDDLDDNAGFDESLTDGFSATESVGLMTGMCSPSTSAIGMGDFSSLGDSADHSNANMPNVLAGMQQQHHFQMAQDDQRKRQQLLQNRLGMNGGHPSAAVVAAIGAGLVQRSNSQHSELGERSSQTNQTERWEEDEPLGDKATKAAVLYSNLCHPHLKTKYPTWTERVKHITREWRSLDAEKRQMYVDMARKNRANSGMTARRRPRRLNAPVIGPGGLLPTDGGSTVQSNPVVTAVAVAPPPPSTAFQPQQLAGASSVGPPNTDLVNAHVSAIKQRTLLQQQNQRKEFEEPDDVSQFDAKTDISIEPSFINGRPPKAESGSTNGFVEMSHNAQKSSPTVQFVVTSMLKQQQQQQQMIHQRQIQTVLLPELVERYMAMKRGVADAEKKLQMHEAEQLMLQKLKKNLSAKRRQLMRVMSTDAPQNGGPPTPQTQPSPQNAQQLMMQKMDAEITQQRIDETRCNMENCTKLVSACRLELHEQRVGLREFELRHGIVGSAGFSEDSAAAAASMINGGGLMTAEGQPQPHVMIGLPNQQPPQAGGVSASIMRPTCRVSSTGAFIVRQQSAPQPPTSANIIQQMSSQFSGSALPPHPAPLVSAGSTPTHGGGGRFVQQTVHRTDALALTATGRATGEQLPPGYAAAPSTAAAALGDAALPPKSGRGRKRKKPLVDEIRSPILGQISFASLQSDFERDVYDTLDYMITQVASVTDRPRHDVTSIKRILYAQSGAAASSQSADVGALTPMFMSANCTAPLEFCSEEPPKAKKKRQQFKRQAISDSNEFETSLGRVHTQLDAFQFPRRTLDQYYEFDTNITYYPYMTNLPDRPGKPFIDGYNAGEYAFSFMPDYYKRLAAGEAIEEERFYPKPMTEICAGANISALLAYEDENLNDIKFAADVKPPTIDISADGFAFWEPDLKFLSLSYLGERAHVRSSALLLGPSGGKAERQPPLEPHRSLFYKDLFPDDDVKVELILEAESIANATALMENLQKILNTGDDSFEFHIKTPPESPPLAGETAISMEVHSARPGVREIKTEPDNGKPARRCRNCEADIIAHAEQRPIEEMASRLGLTPPEEKDEKVAFCSMRCYYKFMVTCKIPLSVELLDRANKYTDEETIEKLRQISTDSFVKKLQQHTADPRLEIKTSFLVPAPAFSSPVGGGADSVTAAELPRVSRENIIRASDLLSIVQSMEAQSQAVNAKGEYKWRGHSWMVCDMPLLQSFYRPQDDKCASVYSDMHEKNGANRADDTRHCALCGGHGDGDQDATGRLLNVDANEWVHVNCALWSSEVHETESGALLNVEAAIYRAKSVNCVICGRLGASLKCYKLECAHGTYHLPCARENGGKFVRDKTFVCPQHEVRLEMRVFRLDALRRIYIQRDENQLLSKIFNHSYPTEMMMRVGSLIFHKIGQLLPEQLRTFHNENHIFPIGYRVTRIFWSPTNPRERIHYSCWIEDRENSPEFCVAFESREFRDPTPSGAWSRILMSVLQAREKAGNMLKFFPNQINGEMLFGFFESAITKMTESLPGVDQLYTYTFKHGGSPLMDLPLAVNPSGCARCEPCFRTLIKRRYRALVSGTSPKKPISHQSNNFSAEVIPREARSTRSRSTRFQSTPAAPSRLDPNVLRSLRASGISEEMLNSPYFRMETVNSSQDFSLYRRMQKEWPNNVYLARSKIQGLGLYAKRDIDMNAMIIEYKGEVIRSEVGETREKRYMAQNRGVYMFRVDEETIIDATMAGGLARYINHSCDPNCSTRILQHNDEKKIIITANRPIKAGEELTYDYQFELEDTAEKLPCLCGAPNCNKWMN